MNASDADIGFQSANVLARAELLDHARNPRNRGVLEGADIVHEEVNPLCGDVVTMYASVSRPHDSLTGISFQGRGCIISQAAASMLTESVRGKTAEEALRLEREDVERMLGGGVSPSRVKCAMLALVALKKGIRNRSPLPQQP